ncbi:MAG: 3-oxoacyl-ACP reductase [Glaciihabitans sp.]|nr:3-oxoacyl-ACP reductase [Glaciihabitans sp.]
MDLGITGKVAVVSASTSGIGLGIAKALAAEGATVVISGRRESLAKEIAATIPGAIGIGVDLTSPTGPNDLIDAVEAMHDSIDILVLNSGGPKPGTAAALTDDDLTVAVNLLVRPQRQLIERVLPGMRERKWGRIIAVGSSGIVAPLSNLAASNIGRAALSGLLKTLANEVGADGVTCNMVLPGRIDTDRIQQLDSLAAERQGKAVEAVRDGSKAAIPVGRYGTIEEFGATAAFLASQQAAYITGSQIRVDGGLIPVY